VQVDGLGADPVVGVGMHSGVRDLTVVAASEPEVAPLANARAEIDEAPVLRLDSLERLSRRVADVLARRPDVPSATGPPAQRRAGTARWLQEADRLLGAGKARPGEHDRARLFAARASVLLAGPATGATAAHDDAIEAARLFEGAGDALAAATGHAVAALAAVRAGTVGQALDDAVQALVAFGSLSDGERDPDGEASLAELLGRLCHQFFDHDRALQFYELAARSLRAGPGTPANARAREARLARVQARLADLVLRQAADGAPAREALLERACDIARSLLEGPARLDGLRLLAAAACECGRCSEGLELLAGCPDDDPLLLLTRARCRHGLGDDRGALADLDTAVAACAAEGDLALQIDALDLRSRVRQAVGELAGALDDARILGDLVWQRHRRQVGGFMDQVWSRAGVEGQRRDLEARARVLLRFAEQDPLTCLANRRAMEQFCTSMHPSEQVCLVLVDVDHFKDVNDRHGHLVGDAVLREVASVLSVSIRSVDRVARWGGEEFLVALPGGTAVLGAEAAGRLRRRIEQHAWSEQAPGLRLTVSAGVSAGRAGDFAAILARADAALYAAKGAGRNRVVSS
jgi:diguanylate cyclase (GGDEF)-like protein